MKTFYCKIADLAVQIHAKNDSVLSYFEVYLIEECTPDLVIAVTDAEIASESQSGTESPAYLEFLAICRAFCHMAYAYDVFLLHAAVIEVDGLAYAFLAPSGTGKTTHICLWRQMLGKRCQIVNGDKPFIRRRDGKFYAYGTPWCGKERLQRNVCIPLSSLCKLARGETDTIREMTAQDAVPSVIAQIYLPPSLEATAHILEMADSMLTAIPCFQLSCTKAPSAAAVAYAAMVEKKQGETQS